MRDGIDSRRWPAGTVPGYFLAKVAAGGETRRLYLTEQTYRLRVDWACEFLDVARDAVGPVMAMVLADAIWDQVAVDDAAAAEIRLQRMAAEHLLLATQPPSLDGWPDHRQ